MADRLWLVDHVVLLGEGKCLIVVAVRHSELPPGTCLALTDLEPIAILPVESSNQHLVADQLEEIAMTHGDPLAILSDAGSDLLGGIRSFCEHRPHTTHFGDVAHAVGRGEPSR